MTFTPSSISRALYASLTTVCLCLLLCREGHQGPAGGGVAGRVWLPPAAAQHIGQWHLCPHPALTPRYTGRGCTGEEREEDGERRGGGEGGDAEKGVVCSLVAENGVLTVAGALYVDTDYCVWPMFQDMCGCRMGF